MSLAPSSVSAEIRHPAGPLYCTPYISLVEDVTEKPGNVESYTPQGQSKRCPKTVPLNPAFFRGSLKGVRRRWKLQISGMVWKASSSSDVCWKLHSSGVWSERRPMTVPLKAALCCLVRVHQHSTTCSIRARLQRSWRLNVTVKAMVLLKQHRPDEHAPHLQRA